MTDKNRTTPDVSLYTEDRFAGEFEDFTNGEAALILVTLACGVLIICAVFGGLWMVLA